jgi:hypothetical protein
MLSLLIALSLAPPVPDLTPAAALAQAKHRVEQQPSRPRLWVHSDRGIESWSSLPNQARTSDYNVCLPDRAPTPQSPPCRGTATFIPIVRAHSQGGYTVIFQVTWGDATTTARHSWEVWGEPAREGPIGDRRRLRVRELGDPLLDLAQ